MHSLTDRLRKTGRAEHAWSILHALTLSLAIASVVVACATIIELILHGSVGFRTVLFWGCVSAFTALPAVLVFRPVSAFLATMDASVINVLARRVGNAYPDVRDTMANAIQLSEQLSEHSSKELVSAAFDQAARASADKDFSVIIDKRKTRRFVVFAISLFSLVAVSLLEIGRAHV